MVRITPLGSHDGDLCRNDRAILLEDPTGVRVLWDPGRTTDENDPRLGEVHVILLSSVHEDHIGSERPNREAPGTCAVPGASPAAETTVAGIAAAKNSAVVAVLETTGFLGVKIQGIRGVGSVAPVGVAGRLSPPARRHDGGPRGGGQAPALPDERPCAR